MTDSIEERSKASQDMVKVMDKHRALMGGTDAMRHAGEKYLPKFAAEDPQNYKKRLAQSWLFNGYRKTVRDMVGRVFAKPVELDGTPPTQLKDWCDNIDLEGNDLSTFARRVLEDGLPAGISYILADAPPRDGVVTKAQAQAQNLRPYLVHIKAEDVLGWKSQTIAGTPTLTQLRLSETATEDDPKDEFKQVTFQQIRVFDRLDSGVMVRIFRKIKGRDGRERWVEQGAPSMTGLPDITIVPFYSNRDGFFTGTPLLDDLADVNIAHWQSQSDQRNILHYARVPMLAIFRPSNSDAQPISISAGQSIELEAGGDVKWVEHSGAAIGSGRQDLKDLEFQMETHGLQLLQPKPGGQSATGEMLDSQKETSILAMTADELEDSLEQALTWLCMYGGLGDAEIEVSVNKEFETSMLGFQEVTAMLQAVNTGNLSKETFLREMARGKIIDPSIDPAEELDRIAADGESLMAQQPASIA